MICPLWKHKL